jgi:hypothetical protein
MRRFISILAVSGCLFAGCTTTRTIRGPDTLEQLEALVWNKRAHITLLQRVPEGATSRVPEPITAFAAPPDGDAAGVPLVEIPNLRGYEVQRRGVGALEGLVVGTVLGFVGGALIALATGNEASSGEARFLTLMGVITGQATGTLIGAAVGHTDRTLFYEEAGHP